MTARSDVTAPPRPGCSPQGSFRRSGSPLASPSPPPLPLLEQGVWYGRTVPRFCRLAVLAHTAALAPATRVGGNFLQYRYDARGPGAGDRRPVAFDSRVTDWACPVSAMPRLANVRFVNNPRPTRRRNRLPHALIFVAHTAGRSLADACAITSFPGFGTHREGPCNLFAMLYCLLLIGNELHRVLQGGRNDA